MIKFLLLIATLFFLIHAGAADFEAIREKTAKVIPFSEEDYRLGTALMKQMKEMAKNKKKVSEKKFFFTEPVVWRTGRLYFTEKYWFDHALFNARDCRENGPSQFKTASLLKNYQLLRDAGLDGFAVFTNNDATNCFFDAAAKTSDVDQKMYVLPTLCPMGAYGTLEQQQLNLVIKQANTFRLNGNPVCATYSSDHMTPEKTAEYIAQIRKITGENFIYIHEVGSISGIGGDPFNFYIRKNAVPATMMLRYYDKLTQYLEICGGIKFYNYLPKRDSTLHVSYYDDVIMPLFSAVCAQEKFNGKKIFMMQIMTGYTNYMGSQNLSRDGTKTLRAYLELCRQYPVDMLLGFEWDETNEDTCLEPTVCKPMSSQRILKYYTSIYNNESLKPLNGDDLSLPNLIVSQPRQFVLGRNFEIELLNVPDCAETIPYTVTVELFGHDGKIVWGPETFRFESSTLKEYTISIPSKQLSVPRLLAPRLTIEYLGRKKVISEGLPFSVIRPTASIDYSWLCTPLRNLMFPSKADVKFSQIRNSGMVTELDATAELEFPGRKLNMVEVIQNSNEIYSFDPRNEYLQNIPSRRLYRFAWQYLNKKPYEYMNFSKEISLINAPSAILFKPVEEPRYKFLVDYSVPFMQVSWTAPIKNQKTSSGVHYGADTFSVEEKDIDKAELIVSGIRLTGPDKDKKISWQIPLKDLGRYGIKSHVFEDGLQFGLETLYRPERLPLPLDTDKVSFQRKLVSDLPEGILALRAVSRDGKVWWSHGYALSSDEGKLAEIQVYNDASGGFHMSVEKNRIPCISYIFDPNQGGNTLTTQAGREYYATIGGLPTISVGFQGLSHSLSAVPGCVRGTMNPDGRNRPTPDWTKLSDGGYALKFLGIPNNFVVFPPSVVPQRAGFTLRFNVFPEETERDQIYFSQYGPNYLTGFRLRTEKGHFVIDFSNRRPHDLNSNYTQLDTWKTTLSPVSGKWNKIELTYDEEKIVLSINQNTETFPTTGISRWMSTSCFGGDGTKGTNGKPQFFQGLLRSFEVIHHAIQ